MRSAANAKPSGVYVPIAEAQAYIVCGWSVVHDLDPHHVLMLPPSADEGGKGGVARETQRSDG